MTDDNHKLDLMPGMVEAGLDVLELNTDVVNESTYPVLWRRIVAEIYDAMEQSRVYQIRQHQKRVADLVVDCCVSRETET